MGVFFEIITCTAFASIEIRITVMYVIGIIITLIRWDNVIYRICKRIILEISSIVKLASKVPACLRRTSQKKIELCGNIN